MEEVKSYLKKLGYEEAEIEEIINDYAIVRLKPETLIKNIERNYNYLLTLGYSQEEVIKMTKSLPAIYGYSIENIKQKVEFYNSINLHSITINDTKKLNAKYSIKLCKIYV